MIIQRGIPHSLYQTQSVIIVTVATSALCEPNIFSACSRKLQGRTELNERSVFESKVPLNQIFLNFWQLCLFLVANKM